MREINNAEDMLDSRDIVEYYESIIDDMDADDEEIFALGELIEQGQTLIDWDNGVTLIRDNYFVEYAKQYADDVGAVDFSATAAWPFDHIDWESAADDLQFDYTALDFDGVTYWAR